ncbi:MAG: immunoglobulin-like domain-containing protein [Candidatus Paceibacterota bacterium]|jgi:hypothetical protein
MNINISKNTIKKIVSLIVASAIMQFAFISPTPAIAAQGCPLNTFYGTVTFNGIATDNATVTLTDVTNGSPALSVVTSLGGFYQIDTSNLNICTVAGDQIQLNATFGAFSTNVTRSFVVEPLTNVNLVISSTATTHNIVSVASTAGGTVTPAGTTPVNSGSSQSYTITPNTGYHIANVLVDGSSVGAVLNYTFNNVTTTHTINASFAINTYNITSSTGANGTISPLGVTSVNHGANRAYTITPNTNFVVADVLVDGVSVGAVATYTFTNVTIAHTISASFAASPVITPIPQQNGTVGQAVTFDVIATNPNQGMLMYTLDANAPIGSSINAMGTFSWTPSIAGTYNFNVIVDDMVSAPVSSPVTIIITAVSPPADTTLPVIILLGANPVDVVQASVFTDPGATASDDVDGNITANIIVTGTVDTATLGSYILTYNVSDAAGNPATSVTRTVNVVAITPNPVLTSISVTPTTASIVVAGTSQLSASALDQNSVALATQPAMTWNSSDTAVATVSATGLVTAVAAGTTNITATSDAVTSNASIVTVTAVGPACQTTADTNLDGVIGNAEILSYIGQWKIGNVLNSLILQAIEFWKVGVGC